MEPPAVVPGFDPVADRKAGLSSGCEHSPVDEFLLQRGQERFGGSVVPAHSGAAHRLGYSVTVTQVGELVRGVLGAPVGVESDAKPLTRGRCAYVDQEITQKSRHEFVRLPHSSGRWTKKTTKKTNWRVADSIESWHPDALKPPP